MGIITKEKVIDIRKLILSTGSSIYLSLNIMGYYLLSRYHGILHLKLTSQFPAVKEICTCFPGINLETNYTSARKMERFYLATLSLNLKGNVYS